MALPAEKERYTFADVLVWDDDERAEIINGEVFLMAPSPATDHQLISGELFGQLHSYLKGAEMTLHFFPFK